MLRRHDRRDQLTWASLVLVGWILSLPRATAAESPWTLAHVLAEVRRGHPALVALRHELRERQAAVTQAALPPNPELEVELEDFAGGTPYRGLDRAEATLSLAQTLRLGGKLTKAERAASAAYTAAALAATARELELLAEATRRFVDLVVADRRLALELRFVALTEAVAVELERRREAGIASAVDRDKAELALQRAQIALVRARRERRAAARRLAAMWGADDLPAPVTAELDVRPALPSLTALLAELTKTPRLRALAAEVIAARARRTLAEAQVVPDLTLRFGGRGYLEASTLGAVASLSLPLPTWNRNQGERAAAAARIRRLAATSRAAQQELSGRVSALWEELAGLDDALRRLETEVLPTARRIERAARQLYARGRYGTLDLLDAQRTLFAVEREHLELLGAYHRTVAELEGILGLPLDRFAHERP